MSIFLGGILTIQFIITLFFILDMVSPEASPIMIGFSVMLLGLICMSLLENKGEK